MKTLVAYFSKNGENSVNFEVKNINVGHTEMLANKIARLTGGDMYPISAKVPYSGNYEEVLRRAKQENEDASFPEIANPLDSIAEYDVIYLGFPNWYRSFPRIIATFIKSYDFKGKIVKPFCTTEEGTFGLAELELAAMLKDAELKSGFGILGKDVEFCDEKLKIWVEK